MAATSTAVYVAEVASNKILVKVTLLEDDCHWIVPVDPPSVKMVLFVLVGQIVVNSGVLVPPTEVGLTVMVEEAE